MALGHLLSPYAEDALLARFMIDRAAYLQYRAEITSQDFSDPDKGRVFALMAMADAKYSSCGIMELTDVAKETGATIVTPQYLATIMDALDATVHDVDSTIKVLKNKTRRRRLHELGESILQSADSDKPVDDVIGEIRDMLSGLASKHEAKDIVTLIEAWLAELGADKKQVVRTGLKAVDDLLGNLEPGNMMVLGARPSMGKTSLAITMAIDMVVRQQKNAMMFSLEMTGKELAQRVTSQVTGMPLVKLRSGDVNEEDFTIISRTITEKFKSRFIVCDQDGQTVDSLYSAASRAAAQMPLDVIFVDYIQLLQAQGTWRESRNLEVDRIAQTLKRLAKDLDCVVVVASQLSRDSAKRKGREKKPQLHDLRDSGAIEQIADQVVLIHRAAYYDEELQQQGNAEADLIVAKNRHGQTGVAHCAFEARTCRFVGVVDEFDYPENTARVVRYERH